MPALTDAFKRDRQLVIFNFPVDNQSIPVSAEYHLITHLLKNYDADARPLLNPNDSVPVQFDIAFKQLLQVVS